VGTKCGWYGFVLDIAVSRVGDGIIYTSGAGRVWHLTLREANGFATRRLIVTDTQRPSETVDARLTWLLTQPGFTGVVFDHGLVATFSQTMDEHDYLNQTGADVLRDCSLISGANFFLRYNETNDDLELAFYNATTSSLDASAIQISNDPADITTDADDRISGDVYPPNDEARLKLGAGRIASGVAVAFDGGSYFANDATTEATFGAVDQVAPTPQVNTKTSAIALTTHLLDQHSVQDERITDLQIHLPAARLNDLLQGQLLQAKFVQFPNWTTARYCRAAVRSFGRPPNLSQGVYDVDLELVPADPQLLSCSYTVLEDGTSALDVWDQWLDAVGDFHGGSSPHPTLVSNTGEAYGDANYEAFGVNAFVLSDPATIDSRWIFDNGTPFWPCSAFLVGDHGTDWFLGWSDDGSTWTDILEFSVGSDWAVDHIVEDVLESAGAHRYWSAHYSVTFFGGGFYAGTQAEGFLLWEGTLPG
jgi:hypothetical protein